MASPTVRSRGAVWACLGLIVGLLLATLAAASVARAYFAADSAPAGAVPDRPGEAFALMVEYVVDGDTIEATAVEPNGVIAVTEPVRIRLIGIDTPEGTPDPECGADAARDHLRWLLPEGSRVWASADEDPTDPYGRSLLYVWTDSGIFVNYDLVAAGFASAMRVAPNDSYAELFTAAETAAREGRVGSWASCR